MSFGHFNRTRLPASLSGPNNSRHASVTASPARYCTNTSEVVGSAALVFRLGGGRTVKEHRRQPAGLTHTFPPRPFPAIWNVASDTSGLGSALRMLGFLLTTPATRINHTAIKQLRIAQLIYGPDEMVLTCLGASGCSSPPRHRESHHRGVSCLTIETSCPCNQ